MIFNETPLAASYVITLQPFSDDRGWFARTYCKREFESIGHREEWVQMNHSFTKQKGSIRGMHFQHSPYEEIKLIRCISGAIYDVIVDIRQDSPTYLQWFGIELSADNGKMLYIPKGFAHGFQTLEDNCALIYHHSAFYMPQVEGGLRYDDPKLGIKWPIAVKDISERDRQHPLIN